MTASGIGPPARPDDESPGGQETFDGWGSLGASPIAIAHRDGLQPAARVLWAYAPSGRAARPAVLDLSHSFADGDGLLHVHLLSVRDTQWDEIGTTDRAGAYLRTNEDRKTPALAGDSVYSSVYGRGGI